MKMVSIGERKRYVEDEEEEKNRDYGVREKEVGWRPWMEKEKKKVK